MTDQLMETPIEEQIRPEHIDLSQSGAQSIDAHSVSINQGGAAQIRADEVTITQGGVGIARTGKLSMSEGGAFAVIADEADVKAGSNVFILLARTASGEVRPFIDLRAAIGIGAGFAIAIALLRRLR